MKKSFIILLVILFVHHCSFGLSIHSAERDSLPTWNFGTSLMKGFFIPHHSYLEHLQEDHSFGIDIYAELKRESSRYWDSLYLMPQLGWNFNYTDMGNEEQLGYHISLMGTMKFPLTKNTRLTPFIRAGMGLGYNSVIWNEDENVYSTVLGSKINFSGRLGFGVDLPISDKFSSAIGLKLDHFSNGAFKIPNTGTNVAWIHLDFNFNPGLQKKSAIKKVVEERQNFTPRKWDLSVAYGFKEVSYDNPKKYGVGVIKLAHHFYETPKSMFGLGLDYIYNSSLNVILTEEDDLGSLRNNSQVGAVLSYGLKYNRLILMYNHGFYLYNQRTSLGLTYSRVALKYFYHENFYAAASLRTHLTRADHIELTIGALLF